MRKLIFRTSHGKALTTFYNLQEKIYDYYGNEIDSCLYFVLFPSNMRVMRHRLEKVCDSFMGEKFEMPETQDEISQNLRKAKVNLDEVYNTLFITIE